MIPLYKHVASCTLYVGPTFCNRQFTVTRRLSNQPIIKSIVRRALHSSPVLNVGGRKITSLSPTEILDVKCIDEGSLKSQATRDPSFCKTHPLVFFYFICPANNRNRTQIDSLLKWYQHKLAKTSVKK